MSINHAPLPEASVESGISPLSWRSRRGFVPRPLPLLRQGCIELLVWSKRNAAYWRRSAFLKVERPGDRPLGWGIGSILALSLAGWRPWLKRATLAWILLAPLDDESRFQVRGVAERFRRGAPTTEEGDVCSNCFAGRPRGWPWRSLLC